MAVWKFDENRAAFGPASLDEIEADPCGLYILWRGDEVMVREDGIERPMPERLTVAGVPFDREQFEPLPIPSRCYDEKHARISAELYGPTGKKPSLRGFLLLWWDEVRQGIQRREIVLAIHNRIDGPPAWPWRALMPCPRHRAFQCLDQIPYPGRVFDRARANVQRHAGARHHVIEGIQHGGQLFVGDGLLLCPSPLLEFGLFLRCQQGFDFGRQARIIYLEGADHHLPTALVLGVVGVAHQLDGLALPDVAVFVAVRFLAELHRVVACVVLSA